MLARVQLVPPMWGVILYVRRGYSLAPPPPQHSVSAFKNSAAAASDSKSRACSSLLSLAVSADDPDFESHAHTALLGLPAAGALTISLVEGGVVLTDARTADHPSSLSARFTVPT